MMTVAELLVCLVKVNACSDAMGWVRSLDPASPAAEAWSKCERSDWMIWLTRNLHVDPKLHALVAVDLGRKALPWWEKNRPGDTRVAESIAAVEAWALGTGSAEAMRAAILAARPARRDADADAYAYADTDAYAYAYADAYADAYAYAYADAYAYAYAYADARRIAHAKARAMIAGVIVQRIPWSVVEAALIERAGG